ncbi:MAG: twin-arginine translocation signal domain-containing protein, partial [Bacteroidota bacterium]
MCDHHSLHRPRAIALEDGHAHDADHRIWTRRDFLVRSGLAATAGGMLLGGTPVRTLAQTPFLHHLAGLETDRVLVLIQLNGGNDGLNTIIPVSNDLYYQARPTLAIPRAETLPLTDDFGLNAELGALEGLWGDGKMAVVQGVGYPDHNLSHFRSTDIVATADTESGTTGWMGRGLLEEFPDYETNPPPAPPAVQIGASVPVLFQAESTNLAMTFASAQAVERVASGAAAY